MNVIIQTALTLISALAYINAWALPGAFDETFGEKGSVELRGPTESERYTSLAVQADGKIVVGGRCLQNNRDDLCVSRFFPDGSIDLAFGGAGRVTLNFSAPIDSTILKIQSDEKILFLGTCEVNFRIVSPFEICAVRFQNNGELDRGFGEHGVFRFPMSPGIVVYSAQLQTNGSILLAMYCGDFQTENWQCFLRLNADGSLDRTFGKNGFSELRSKDPFTQTLLGFSSDAYGRLLSLVSCERADPSRATPLCLYRFLPTGMLDLSFGNGGVVKLPLTQSGVDVLGSIREVKGRILVVSNCTSEAVQLDCAVLLEENGALSTSGFGRGTGKAQFVTQSAVTSFKAQIDADGYFFSIRLCEKTICIRFYDALGEPNLSINSGSLMFQSEPSDFLFIVPEVHRKPDGSFYMANWSGRVRQFDSKGALDSSFAGGNGFAPNIPKAPRTVMPILTLGVGLYGVKVIDLPTGKYLVGATCNSPERTVICLTRFMQNGDIDVTFGIAGTKHYASSTFFNDWLLSMTVLRDGKILMAHRCALVPRNSSRLFYEFCLTQFTADGKLDVGFGEGGTKRLYDSQFDVIRSISLTQLEDGRIAVSSPCRVGLTNDSDTCVSFVSSKGEFDPSFNSARPYVPEVNFEAMSARNIELLVDQQGNFLLVSWCFITANTRSTCLARFDAAGRLDLAFGNAGRRVLDGEFYFAGFVSKNLFGMAKVSDNQVSLMNQKGEIQQVFDASPGRVDLRPITTFTGERYVSRYRCGKSQVCERRFFLNGRLDTAYGVNGVAESIPIPIERIDLDSNSALTVKLSYKDGRTTGVLVGELQKLIRFSDSTPLNGWWWSGNAQPGTGFFFETQGSKSFATFFMYDETGRPIWFTASGNATVNANGDVDMSASLLLNTNGQTIGGVYRAPVSQPIGSVRISLKADGTGIVVLPNRTDKVERYKFQPTLGKSKEKLPVTGWFWSSTEAGRGYAIEVQNGVMFLAMFHYDSLGAPIWNTYSGPISDAGLTSGDWQFSRGGRTLDGPYRTPSAPASTAGFAASFDSRCLGRLTLPGASQTVPITRFSFGESMRGCL